MLMFINNFYKIKSIFLNILIILYLIFTISLYSLNFITHEGLFLLLILFIITYAFFIHLFEDFSKDIDTHTQKMKQTILENIPQGIMITNHNGVIVYVNKQFEIITQYQKQAVIGINASILKSGHHKENFYQKLWNRIQNEGYYVGEVINRKKNGELYHQKVCITAIYNQTNIDSYIAIFSDISEEKEFLKRLKNENQNFKKQAQVDYLTNIYNRSKFDNILEYEFKKYLRYQDTFCLLFVDIDFFKKINDSYGHDVGDNILVEFSDILSCNIRQSDTVARWGGEEFIILLSNTSLSEAKIMANKLKETIQMNTFSIEQTITASMGLVEFNETYNLDTLIKAADTALYEAKKNGRNQVKVAS